VINFLYLQGYPELLLEQARDLIYKEKLEAYLSEKYPDSHRIKTDKLLYEYIQGIKSEFLQSSGLLNKVTYDSKLQVIKDALGTHTSISRVQGKKLKSKREIRIASLFKNGPLAFLKMIATHELAHLKESGHGKGFYQLCIYIEPKYHQIEFDLRMYLTYLDGQRKPLWN